MSLQLKINQIIQSNKIRSQKIAEIRALLIENHITLLSDFDDTITTEDSLCYSLYKISSRFGNAIPVSAILDHIRINPYFLSYFSTPTQIVLLSRNHHIFLEQFQLYASEKGLLPNIEVLAIIGQYKEKGFTFSSHEKLLFLPEVSLFIGDAFEDASLQKYEKFIKIDKTQNKSIDIYLRKIVWLSIFLFQFLIAK